MCCKSGLISVIVPIYNVEDYLGRCLRSIMNNTYRNIEIICVNDGSPDNCEAIITELYKIDNRIIYIKKENGGLSSARNAGLKVAKGEYIAFIDSDDWIHQRYFEFLIKAIIENDADISICDYEKLSDFKPFPKNIVYKANVINLKDMMASERIKSFVWKRLYKRTIIDNITFDEQEKVEDALFNMDIICKNPNLKIVYVDCVLQVYYIREGSLARQLTFENMGGLAKEYYKLFLSMDNLYVKSILADEIIDKSINAWYKYNIIGNNEKGKEFFNMAKICYPFSKRYKVHYMPVIYFPKIYVILRHIKNQ